MGLLCGSGGNASSAHSIRAAAAATSFSLLVAMRIVAGLVAGGVFPVAISGDFVREGSLKALAVAGLKRIDAELKKVYAALGRPDNWRLVRYETGHQETADGRREVLEFLQSKL